MDTNESQERSIVRAYRNLGETAKVYMFTNAQEASAAKSRIASFGLDAYMLPAPMGRMRLAVILPQGGR